MTSGQKRRKTGHRGFKHPLAEVFGFAVDDFTDEAEKHRANRLCPFGNSVPNCTKVSAINPLGVCSLFEDGSKTTIICPIRFRQKKQITIDAADFFFTPGQKWTSLTEIRLNDKNGRSAGNIDIVLAAYDNNGRIVDFGALEVQGVYISGNIRRLFDTYMENPKRNFTLDWTSDKNYPRPDYLSSSRKRLVPQLIYKGGILRKWKKKIAVALHESFYDTLPSFQTVSEARGEIAWMIYDLTHDEPSNSFALKKKKIVYTLFEPSMQKIITTEAGAVADFISVLQEKLDEQLSGASPDTPTLADIVLEE